MWYVYVLLCNDNSFYCGITKNIDKRLKQHNGLLKGGAKYTRGRRPCKVIYKEKASDRSDASKKECSFKKLNRREKEKFLFNYSAESSLSEVGSTLSSHSSPSSRESCSQTTSDSGSTQPSSSEPSSQSSA